MFFLVSHRTVKNIHKLDTKTPQAAVALFREMFGRTETNHAYNVVDSDGQTHEIPYDPDECLTPEPKKPEKPAEPKVIDHTVQKPKPGESKPTESKRGPGRPRGSSESKQEAATTKAPE